MAAGGIAGALLFLDAILVLVARSDEFTRISPLALTTAQPIDPARFTRVVVVLAALPLFAAGLGVVRAYAPLVLLQSGDPERTVYDGSTAWFWRAIALTVVPPLLLTALLGRCSATTDTAAAPILLAVLGRVLVIAILAGDRPGESRR